MKIDAHHHLWDLNAVSYPWILNPTPRFFGDHAPIRRNYLLDEFRKDAADFDASVHIQVGAADPWAEAQWVDQQAQNWPLKQVVFCDLTAPDVEAQLDKYQTLTSVKGVRQIVGRAAAEDAKSGTNTLLTDPAFKKGLEIAAERGLSFDLQLTTPLIHSTAKLLSKIPNLKVALCHAGSPHDRTPQGLTDWAQNLKHLSALPNVTCKLSGLGMFDHTWTTETIKPIVDEVLAQFTPMRAMFGSNFPVDSLYSDYATLSDALHTLVPANAHEDVFCQTAKKFYEFG